jgi:lipopolysaccharide heptosyltransferase II
MSGIASLLKMAKRIRQEGYDLSVDLQNSKWTHLLAALSGIPERFGFQRGLWGFLVNRPDKSFATADSPVKHQFRVLSKLGVKKLDETLELWPDPAAEIRVEEWLTNAREDSIPRLVGLAIGSSPKWETKRWPVERFKQLAETLIKKHDCTVVLLGSSQDAALAQEVRNGNSNRCLDFVGKTSLAELISLIKRLDVVVTGDTAPLHVAAAMKVKTVALFGPTDSKRHMPPGTGNIVLTRHLPCQFCYKGECRNKEILACLKKISAEEVLQAVEKQLVPKPVVSSKL